MPGLLASPLRSLRCLTHRNCVSLRILLSYYIINHWCCVFFLVSGRRRERHWTSNEFYFIQVHCWVMRTCNTGEACRFRVGHEKSIIEVAGWKRCCCWALHAMQTFNVDSWLMEEPCFRFFAPHCFLFCSSCKPIAKNGCSCVLLCSLRTQRIWCQTLAKYS